MFRRRYQTNCVSLAKLTNFLKDCQFLEKYVHISSPEVYGQPPETVLDALIRLQAQIQREKQPLVPEHGGLQSHPEAPDLMGKPIKA
ncbi:MAG: hypothetical protein D6780_01665 [Candidatus Dadabacteria bacterium]|nr:MAG: hypothetical protein D6780_01665 [Candidatus Dadabacteria bacterium]